MNTNHKNSRHPLLEFEMNENSCKSSPSQTQKVVSVSQDAIYLLLN